MGGPAELVFVPEYGGRLAGRLAPYAAPLVFLLLLLGVWQQPRDWRLWAGLVVTGAGGVVIWRRPRRIRLGERIVIERGPFPPTTFDYADIRRIEPAQIRFQRGRLVTGSMQNAARLHEILQQRVTDGRLGEAQVDADAATLNGRDVLLVIISLPIAMILTTAFLFLSERPPWIDRLGGKLYGLLVSMVCWIAVFAVLRIWDQRFREREPTELELEDEDASPRRGILRVAHWSLRAMPAIALVMGVWYIHELVKSKRERIARREAVAHAHAWDLAPQPCALGIERGFRQDSGLVGRWVPLNGGNPLEIRAEPTDANSYWVKLGTAPGQRLAVLGELDGRGLINLDARTAPEQGERWLWMWIAHDGDALTLEGLRPASSDPEPLSSALCASLVRQPDLLQANGAPLRYRRGNQVP